MIEPDNLRYTKLALSNEAGAIPALGFGTLIPDPIATQNATRAALEAGFRALDTAERYRTEKEVGEAMQEVHVESHPYLPEWELLEFCHKNGIVFQAFAALGHSSEPRLPDDPVISS